MPGFDPARALARPTGTFVLLDHVKLSLVVEPDGGSIEHELAWVNRYVVERVESDLELGFFFPGAESVIVQDTYTPRRGPRSGRDEARRRRPPAAERARRRAEPGDEPSPAA